MEGSAAPPLWPAGNLPLTGEIRCHGGLRQLSMLKDRAPSREPPISPLEGEMSGRTERGA
ncbi:lytic murein transglycosylase [Mesorhizobium sp. B2-8-3]|nr:lytic murein transglycosylase [Mesorhizobium sp. B2-8-3]